MEYSRSNPETDAPSSWDSVRDAAPETERPRVRAWSKQELNYLAKTGLMLTEERRRALRRTEEQ